jgi:hypothetical protein
MRVFVLYWHDEFEGVSIEGVYSSREKAEQNQSPADSYIEEVELDELSWWGQKKEEDQTGRDA